MANLADVVNDDAFSVTALTTAFIQQDHVPGRSGELIFQSVGEGVQTLTATFEVDQDVITLLSTAPRGGPGNREGRSKRKVHSVPIPHIPDDDTIHASEVAGIREMGTTDAVQTVQSKVNSQLRKIGLRHDLTLENLRFGALQGIVRDADGSAIYSLFDLFGVTQEVEVSFALGTAGTDVRGKCQAVQRLIRQNAKMALPSSAKVWCFAGDNFFDALTGHANVKGAYDGYAAAERRLGDSYAYGIFEFGGIFFENYRGSDGVNAGANTTAGGAVGIDPDKAMFFLTDAPGLYAEYYAPGDFVSEMGSTGLPRYASIALDPLHGRFIDVHTEQNPLPVCLRPKTLMKAAKA